MALYMADESLSCAFRNKFLLKKKKGRRKRRNSFLLPITKRYQKVSEASKCVSFIYMFIFLSILENKILEYFSLNMALPSFVK